MKKILFFLMLVCTVFSCKKEQPTPSFYTQANLKGKWKANFTGDVVFDNATGNEIARVNYLHGVDTELSFDGNGSLVSVDNEFNTTLTHSYSLREDGEHAYLNTQIVGLDAAEYQFLALTGTELQMKGIIIKSTPYSVNGKNYIAHYERTQYFTRQ